MFLIVRNQFLIFLIIPFALSAQDRLTNAIKLSNPRLVLQEINTRLSEGKPFSHKEQLFYLDFCEEVITRRRNAIQFPIYQSTPIYCNGVLTYYNKPVYTKAYTSDGEPEISVNCSLRCVLGTMGTIGALLYWYKSIINFPRTYGETTNKLVFASGVISFIALFSAVIEIEAKRRQYQEELYENAIQIKHIVYEIPVA